MNRAMQDSFSGRVRDISSEGHGVVDHPEGRIFFVRGTWPGDEGEFLVESTKKKYGTARLLKLTKSSPARQESPCPHFGWKPGQCGGCPWIFVDYKAQLEQKQKRVEYLIERNQLATADFKAQPIVPSPLIYGYRNRAQLKTDGRQLGYVSPETKQIAPVQDCIVLSDKNRETLKELSAQLPQPRWRPRPPYLWSLLDIDESLSAQEVLPNVRRPFQQGNTQQNEFMKNWLREQLRNQDSAQPIVELFGGSGNFTQVLSDAGFLKIDCAEIDAKAVQTLEQKKIRGARGFVVDLYDPHSWKKIPQESLAAEVLVLDPPREGFPQLKNFIAEFENLKTIIYISCEPFRWALDIKDLVMTDWKLKKVQPIDQFPHTPHTELLSVLQR